MKTIIAGSRGIHDYDLVVKAIEKPPWELTEIVSGGAMGVDTLGELYAKEHNIPAKIFPAEWKKYGKQAGYLRNEKMAVYADALIAVWDGRSKGTKHMINLANKYKLEVYVWKL